MTKLKLQASPTFDVKVDIPLPGGASAQLLATFAHRTRDDFRAWLDAGQSRADEDTILEMLKSWDLDAPLDRASVTELVQNYIGAAVVLIEVYIKELSRGRLGN